MANRALGAPRLTGQQLVSALKKGGFSELSKRGSHVKLRKQQRTVIVPVHMHGRLRESGEPVAYELVQVWTGRDGKAIRLVTYPDRETAEADADVAGLPYPVAR